jgi:high-affinity Fe2+/Pb2+ permease
MLSVLLLGEVVAGILFVAGAFRLTGESQAFFVGFGFGIIAASLSLLVVTKFFLRSAE